VEQDVSRGDRSAALSPAEEIKGAYILEWVMMAVSSGPAWSGILDRSSNLGVGACPNIPPIP
jgi:hypothetical protein